MIRFKTFIAMKSKVSNHYTLTISNFTPSLGLRLARIPFDSNQNTMKRKSMKTKQGSKPSLNQSPILSEVNMMSGAIDSNANSASSCIVDIKSTKDQTSQDEQLHDFVQNERNHCERKAREKNRGRRAKNKKRGNDETYVIVICKDSAVFHFCEDIRSTINYIKQHVINKSDGKKINSAQLEKYRKMNFDDWLEFTYSSDNPNRDSNVFNNFDYSKYNMQCIIGAATQVIKAKDIIETITISTKDTLVPIDMDHCVEIFKDPKNYPLHIMCSRFTSANKIATIKMAEIEEVPKVSEIVSIDLTNSTDDESYQDSNHHHKKETYVNFSQSRISQLPTRKAQDCDSIRHNRTSCWLIDILVALPDPIPEYELDEVVITSVGVGRIISQQIRRYVESQTPPLSSIIVYEIRYPCFVMYSIQDNIESISSTDWASQTVLKYKKIHLTRMDVLRLDPQTYINDSLVNFLIKVYMEGLNLNDEKVNINLEKSIYIYPTYFYTRICNSMGRTIYKDTKEGRKKLWEEIKGWTNGIDILEKQFLIVPVNYALHWSFALICNPGLCFGIPPKYSFTNSMEIKSDESLLLPCILNFDSGKQFRLHRSQTVNSVLRKYLNAYFENFTCNQYDSDLRRNVEYKDRISAANLPCISVKCPQQMNLSDCGIYMLDMIEKILLHPPKVDAEFINNKDREWDLFTLKTELDVDNKRLRIKGFIYQLMQRNRKKFTNN